MKTNYLILVLSNVLFAVNSLWAQDSTFEWVSQMGGTGSDRAECVTQI